MRTKTVLIDVDTYARLVEMSNLDGVALSETIRDAAEVLSRKRFAQRASAEFAELLTDREAWASYLAEAESTSVADGLG